MFGSCTYLIWLAAFLGVPIVTLGAFHWRLWWQERRSLGWTLVGAGFGGWAWDFTAIQLGYWNFASSNLVGLSVGGLPIEEWLWIFGVTWLFGGLALILGNKHLREPAALQPESSDHLAVVAPVGFIAWIPPALSQTVTTLIAGAVFHGILWTRNGRFLRRCSPVLAQVTGISVIWLLATDPIGAAWGAWYYDPNRVVGIWIFGLIPVEDVLGIIVVGSAAAGAAMVFAFSPRRWV